MIIIPPSQPLPNGLSYRKGTNEDAEQIIAVVHATLVEYGLVPEPYGVDKDLSQVEKSYKDGYFGVITKEEVIVATYGLSPIKKDVVEIRKMYAIPDVRGMGLGRWMLHHLLSIAKHNQYKWVELETASCLKEAIALYQKAGFQEKPFENKTPRCDRSFIMRI